MATGRTAIGTLTPRTTVVVLDPYGGLWGPARPGTGLRARKSKSGPSTRDWAAQVGRCGAKEQNRTADTAIFSRMLYLLSYLGVVGEAGLEPATPSV